MASSLPSSRLKPPLLSSSSMPAKGAAEAVTTEVIERLFVCDISRDFYYFWLHFTFVNNQTFFWRWIFQKWKKTESTARSEKQSTATEMNFCRRRVLLIFVAFRAGKETGRANTSLSHQEPPSAFWPSPKDQNRATSFCDTFYLALGRENFINIYNFWILDGARIVSILFWIF